VPNTKANWPIDRRSQYNLDLNLNLETRVEFHSREKLVEEKRPKFGKKNSYRKVKISNSL
jgi:hypothetical protein